MKEAILRTQKLKKRTGYPYFVEVIAGLLPLNGNTILSGDIQCMVIVENETSLALGSGCALATHSSLLINYLLNSFTPYQQNEKVGYD